MDMKIVTSARVDKAVLEESKALGANVSIILENALREFNQRNSPRIKPKSRTTIAQNGGTLVEEAKTDKIAKEVCHHPSSNLGNPNSSSFSSLGLPSASQPRIS